MLIERNCPDIAAPMKITRALQVAAIAALEICRPASAQNANNWPPPGVSFYGATHAPDISGLWLGTETGVPGQEFAPNRGSADGRPATFWAPWPLPYTPDYQAISDRRVAAAKAGRQLGDIGARCAPFSTPQSLVAKTYPDEIVQTPGEVTIFRNNSFPIIVWTDGRGHPQNWKPSYNGHSIGYWVGDTLFADTVGIRADTPLDHMIDPHGPNLHIKWSVRRVAADVLHFHVTLFDAAAFTEPVSTTNIWHRITDARWQVLDDASCFENNQSDTKSDSDEGFAKY